MRGRLCRVACACLSLAIVACSGASKVNVGDAGGAGGTASAGAGTAGTAGGGAAGGGAAGGGGSSLYVNATTVSTMTEYPDVVGTRVAAPDQTELDIVGTVAGDGGTEGHLRLHVVTSTLVPGTYACSPSTYITTLQLCCPNVYDSRNEPIDADCSITLSEVGSTDVAGTFSGITHDEWGGRMFLRDGRFRVRLEE